MLVAVTKVQLNYIRVWVLVKIHKRVRHQDARCLKHYTKVDVMQEIATVRERTIAQIALNWLLQRPTVSSVIIGARNEAQLCANLEAAPLLQRGLGVSHGCANNRATPSSPRCVAKQLEILWAYISWTNNRAVIEFIKTLVIICFFRIWVLGPIRIIDDSDCGA